MAGYLYRLWLSAPLSIFVSALTDIIGSVRSSTVIGLFVIALYSIAFLAGIWIEDIIYDTVQLPITIISYILPPPSDIYFDVGSYIIILWIGSSIALRSLRFLLFCIVWSSFHLRLYGTISSLISAAAVCLLFLVLLTIWPDEYADPWIIKLTGYVAMAGLLSAALAVWTFCRYRAGRWSKARQFDIEVGSSLYHLSSSRNFSDLGIL